MLYRKSACPHFACVCFTLFFVAIVGLTAFYQVAVSEEAKRDAIEKRKKGIVAFEEDGFGVWREKQKIQTLLNNESFDFASIVMEVILVETC